MGLNNLPIRQNEAITLAVPVERSYRYGIKVFIWLLFSMMALILLPSLVKAQGVPELMYFRFDVPGPTVPNEAVPATAVSLNGTLTTNTIGGAGQFTTALQGNGSTGSSFDANWPMNLTGPWTISMWFSGVTNLLSSNYPFGASGGSTFRALTGSGVVAGAGNLELRATGMTDIFANNVFDAVGTPVVITVVYDPANLISRVYVNGTLQGSFAQPASLTLTGTNFTIGNYATSTGLPTGGKMDEFRLYNRVVPASEIAATWNQPLPLTPCAGPPTAGTATASPASPCFGSPSTLFLLGATSASGLTYQWESDPGTGWAPIAGATSGSYVIPSVTASTQYRAWVRCGTDSTLSSVVTVGATATPLPYTEDFESITANNQLPNCMTSTNISTNTRTYTATQTFGTNHTAGGSKFGTFYYSPAGTNAFFTPKFNLVAGTTYLFRFWYMGVANAATYTNFGAYFGTSNSIAGMTNLIGTFTPTNTGYQEFAQSFTPTVSGLYNLGIMGTSAITGTNYYVSIDDLNLKALDPCTGRPTAGTIAPVTPCPNANFNLTRVGGTLPTTYSGLTFEWQDSSSAGTWAPSPGINNLPNYVGNIAVPTKFRLVVICTNSNMADTTTAFINVQPFLNCYCIPTYATGATTSIIAKATLNTLSKSSSGVAPWYVDYSPQQPATIPIPVVTMGVTDTLKIQHGTWTVNYSGVWIDFNHSATFDANEFFSLGTTVGANGIANIPVTPPLTALPGLTRMRIRAGDRALVTAAMPCGAQGLLMEKPKIIT